MKHFYVLLFILPFISTAQDSLYSKVYYEGFGFSMEAISVTESIEDYGVCFVSTSSQGMQVTEVDSLGDQNWNKTFGNLFYGEYIISTADTGYVITGSYYNNLEQINDPFIMKLNGDGDTLWTRGMLAANPNNPVYKTAVTELLDGSYLMAWMNQAEYNIYLANISPSGVLNWSNIVAEPDFSQIEKITQTSDSSIYLIGYNDPWSNGKIVKLDKNGNLIWGNSYQGIPFYDVEIMSDTLYCYGTSNAGFHAYSVIDSSGAFVNGTFYPDMNNQSGDPVMYKYTDTSFLIMKPSEYFDNGVLLINLNGQILNAYMPEMKGLNILSAKNKGLFFLGNGPLYGIKSITPHVGLIRVDSLLNQQNCFYDGWFTNEQVSTPTVLSLSYWETIGITEYPVHPTIDQSTLMEVIRCVEAYSGIDENELVANVYPNISSSIFTFEIENTGSFELKVFDLSGKELVSDEFNWVNYQLDLSDLQSGSFQYILREKDSGLTKSGRLILAK
jgi:hypothetical protein